MKKVASIIVLVVLLSSLLITAASAQFTVVTSFQVQNLSGTQAQVTLEFYDASGAVVSAATLYDTIDGNKSKLYTQANNTNLPSGFNGSVVVSADQPIAAIAVQEARNASDQVYQGTYSGFSAESASGTFYIPIVEKGFYGYTTEISIQNASDSNVDVTINYTGGHTDSRLGLLPGQVVRFDNADTVGMPTGYFGSAIVSATGGNVVAVVNQNNVAALKQQTYEGFSAGAAGPELYAPVLMRTFYGFNTSVQVQLVGAGPADVTIHYSNGTSKTQTLTNTGDFWLFTQGNDAGIPDNWIGSARITSTGGNIIAVVSQDNADSGKAASYNAFASTATKYVGPNVMKNFYGFNTSVQVQNIGSDATCTATFSNGTSQSTPADLAQYGTHLFTQSNNAALGTSFIGSVEVTCEGQPLVAIVNQNGPDGVGDNAMAYNAIAGQ